MIINKAKKKKKKTIDNNKLIVIGPDTMRCGLIKLCVGIIIHFYITALELGLSN